MQRKRSVYWFLGVFLVMAVPLGMAVASMDRFDLHRTLHMYYSPLLDRIFRFGTHLADGLVPTAIALVLLFSKSLRSFLMMALGCSASAIVVQVLKQGPFAEMDRPFMFQQELEGLHWVPGVELHHHFSFPSGHSAAAFSMCMALAVLNGRPLVGAIMAVVAGGLAFSRVYLSQHFAADILAGATIGALTSLVIYYLLYIGPWAHTPRLNERLFRSGSKG